MKSVRLAIVALCLPLLGCYEEPVRDHLHIVFSPGPALVITAVRDIASPATASDNPAVEDRMDDARTDLESGWDRWSRSFSELGAIADRSTIVRHDARARRGIHSALVVSFRPVERLLGNEGLGAFYDEAGGIRTLELHPTGGGQATRQQRDTLEDDVALWAKSVADYLAAATALYEYLDVAPDRAALCFGYIFDEDQERLGPLNDEEAGLVSGVVETMERVADALLIDNNQAYSLNELSRLVHDTFQGRLTIAIDGPILEIEGFADHSTYLERPPVDLWRGLEVLAEKWLQPDIVTSLVRPGPDEIQPDPDPLSFTSQPRTWAPAPDASIVESELRAQLQPEEVYVVRWQTRPAPADDDEVYELALQQLATAEQNLPD
jgi:hypothetical protein